MLRSQLELVEETGFPQPWLTQYPPLSGHGLPSPAPAPAAAAPAQSAGPQSESGLGEWRLAVGCLVLEALSVEFEHLADDFLASGAFIILGLNLKVTLEQFDQGQIG